MILIACGLGCFPPVAIAQNPATSRKPPNILFIFSDDHAYQAISAYNDPRRLIETPHIDRLAREGMRFDRCVVPNSICGPSRASVLTGKYSHRNGFYNNTNSRFDGSQATFPKLLHGAGYQTAIVGKWHLVTDPTGFDEWHILPGQGVYYNPPMIHNGQKVQHQGYTTDIITDSSIAWLKKSRQIEAVLADVPAQGTPPRVAAGAPPPGPRQGSLLPRAAHALRRLFRSRQGRARPGHDDRQDDERRRSEADAPQDPDARAAQGLGRLLRAAQRRLPQSPTSGQGPRPLEVSAIYARLPRLHQGGGRVGRTAAEVPRRRGARREHHRGLHGRSGLLPRRARLVR